MKQDLQKNGMRDLSVDDHEMNDPKDQTESVNEEQDYIDPDEAYEREQEQAAMEGELDIVTCPVCKGEGITLVANDDDENDRDFGTCSICGGSGEIEGCDDEDEWARLGGEDE